MVLFAVISSRFDAVSSRAQYMDVEDWTKYVPHPPMGLKGSSRVALPIGFSMPDFCFFRYCCYAYVGAVRTINATDWPSLCSPALV
jgi:hypothetical protein